MRLVPVYEISALLVVDKLSVRQISATYRRFESSLRRGLGLRENLLLLAHLRPLELHRFLSAYRTLALRTCSRLLLLELALGVLALRCIIAQVHLVYDQLCVSHESPNVDCPRCVCV
jgi:hypothetical protein